MLDRNRCIKLYINVFINTAICFRDMYMYYLYLFSILFQVNNLIRLYNTSLKFLLPSIIKYMKQNDIHEVNILYLYTRGQNN